MSLNFLCLIAKFPLFKLFDLIRRKIYNDFNAEDEDRLTPFKDDKLKAFKFGKYKAQLAWLFDDQQKGGIYKNSAFLMHSTDLYII